jgi:hypothetical protein
MITSKQGIELIKGFEGCRLTSYRLPSEEKYTIGYGHYGVEKGVTITELEAEKYLLRILFAPKIKSINTTAFTILIKISLMPLYHLHTISARLSSLHKREPVLKPR